MLVNIITYFQGLLRYDACYLVLFCGTGLMAGLKNYRYDLRDFMGNRHWFSFYRSRFKNEPRPQCVNLGG